MGAGYRQVAIEAGREVVALRRGSRCLRRARRAGSATALAGVPPGSSSTPTAIDDWIDGRQERLRHSPTLDGIAGEADLVIEAALEDLQLKSALFRTLDAEARPDAILATNTSALSVAAIAEADDDALPRPRFALLQPGAGWRSWSSWPRRPRRPGCRRPRRGHDAGLGQDRDPMHRHARVHRQPRQPSLHPGGDGAPRGGSGVAEAIDAAVRAAGFPLGPFELMDLTGLDVTTAASGRSTWEVAPATARTGSAPRRSRRSSSRTGASAEDRPGFYRYDAIGAEVTRR